ncbi:MAG TPA: hypothetical protein VGP88_08390, partial [Thermoplasmata archaeon]|nr:hypothetical protein [Thermoplasmata archaeon]
MHAGISVADGSPHRHRRLPRTRTGFEGHGPSGDRPARPGALGLGRARRRETDDSSGETGNLAASFPLFFFGGGCLAIAGFVAVDEARATIGRLPLWGPFLALGIIAVAGGALSLFAVPDGDRRDPRAESGFRPTLAASARSPPPHRAVRPRLAAAPRVPEVAPRLQPAPAPPAPPPRP